MSKNVSRRSRNFLKNIKMTYLQIFLTSFILLSIAGMVYLGLNDMKAFNNDMKSLYADRMITSLQLKDIETKFYKISLEMARMVGNNQYDENAVKIIRENQSQLQEVLNSYKGSLMNEEQKKLLNDIEKSYQIVFDRTNSLIDSLKAGRSVSVKEAEELVLLTSSVEDDIKKLVELNAEIAGQVVDKANQTYEKTRNIFMYITAALVVLISIASYFIIKLLKDSMLKINKIMEKLSNYDFSIEVVEDGKNEFAQMEKSLIQTIANIKNIVKGLKEKSENLTSNSQTLSAVSEEMASSSQELASTMQEVAKGATSQAQELNDIVNLIGNLTSDIENVYVQLKKVKDETENTSHKANIGKEEMDKLIKSIEEVKKSFEVVFSKVNNLIGSVEKISKVTEVINGISEQTSLLALNAAIEAARAGEAGRGFAVVAEEIRKLAEESKKSTEEIEKLVESIQFDTDEVLKTTENVDGFVKEQVVLIENTVMAFGDILDSINRIAPLMDNTYEGMDRIVQSKDDVLEKVESVSAVTQENSASSEEVAASSQELSASSEEVAAAAQNVSGVASELMEYVALFKI